MSMNISLDNRHVSHYVTTLATQADALGGSFFSATFLFGNFSAILNFPLFSLLFGNCLPKRKLQVNDDQLIRSSLTWHSVTSHYVRTVQSATTFSYADVIFLSRLVVSKQLTYHHSEEKFIKWQIHNELNYCWLNIVSSNSFNTNDYIARVQSRAHKALSCTRWWKLI